MSTHTHTSEHVHVHVHLPYCYHYANQHHTLLLFHILYKYWWVIGPYLKVAYSWKYFSQSTSDSFSVSVSLSLYLYVSMCTHTYTHIYARYWWVIGPYLKVAYGWKYFSQATSDRPVMTSAQWSHHAARNEQAKSNHMHRRSSSSSSISRSRSSSSSSSRRWGFCFVLWEGNYQDQN